MRQKAPFVIRDNRSLSLNYHLLKKNDIILGNIRLHQGEETLLSDLLQRGVRIIPSATAQLASRSKTLQVRLFAEYMPPDTMAIYNHHGLLEATSLFHQRNYPRLILKMDKKNSGLGVHRFKDIEDLYNLVQAGGFTFPFVVQPFFDTHRDIRVIILDDYVEAYERSNPHNFRKNMHCGGTSAPFTLSEEQRSFCKAVMQRGGFPWAHLDLMLLSDSSYFLQEINLRGGLRGARINNDEYLGRIEHIQNQLLEKTLQP